MYAAPVKISQTTKPRPPFVLTGLNLHNLNYQLEYRIRCFRCFKCATSSNEYKIKIHLNKQISSLD